MKNMMPFLALLVAGFAALSSADVLDVGTATFEGTFEGYEHGLFHFRAKDGRLLKELRNTVRSLEMSKPREINLLRSGSGDWEDAYLVGYNRFNFSIKQDGRPRTVSGLRVKQISTQTLSAMREAGRQPAGRSAPQGIDTSGLENNPNLSPEQAKAFARYKAARRKYEAFVAENSAMVARMDNATGSERDELLMTLRRRKAEEQPVTAAVRQAENALLKALPNGVVPAKTPARPAPRPARPAAPVTQTTIPKPKLPTPGKDGVILINVSGLAKLPDLDEVQAAALTRYKAAAARYRRAAEKPVAPETKGERDKAVYESKGALRRAQQALLRAFPGISFE